MAFPKWYLEWPAWKRVLYDWRNHYNRVGMTIQALGSLLNDDPKEMIREMVATKGAYVQWCTEVQAPVWSVKRGDSGPASPDHLVRLAHWSLTHFPPPEFKSMQYMQGHKDWRLGGEYGALTSSSETTSMVNRLRAAGKGLVYARKDETW